MNKNSGLNRCQFLVEIGNVSSFLNANPEVSGKYTFIKPIFDDFEQLC